MCNALRLKAPMPFNDSCALYHLRRSVIEYRLNDFQKNHVNGAQPNRDSCLRNRLGGSFCRNCLVILEKEET
jgi:hypothetical protein